VTKHKFSKSISNHVHDGNWGEIENIFNNTEFAKHLGINVNLDEPSKPKCEINDIKAFHLGGVGQDYVNGAVISGVFDLVIGLTALQYSSRGNFATSNVNIRFLKPVEKNRFYTIAKINSIIGNRVFSEATLFNCKGEPCGYANGEIRVGID
tara:strand:- start:1035 stop:1490 length:456 start_codon:yes stop_codon:yes gene_type:complete